MTSKSQLERSLERKCVVYAEEMCSFLSIKLDNAKRGWPDRLFLGPGKQMFLVEFKRPGEGPTKKQIAVHAMLGVLGFKVWVIDDFEEFAALVGQV